MLKFTEKMLAGQFAYHAAEVTLGAFVKEFLA
jgi:hypothetical protein